MREDEGYVCVSANVKEEARIDARIFGSYPPSS